MKWFQNINSLDELRNTFKKLLFKYHPDNNPGRDTTKEMQEINAEYDKLLNQFKHSSSGNNFTADSFDEEELKQVLNSVVVLKADIIVELVGRWIWISGDTFPVKSQLKELGFRWAGKKKMWYWGRLEHPSTTAMDMTYIRAKYGSTAYACRKEESEAIGAYN